MEKSWKFVCLCLVVPFFKLCNGLPILFESNITADPSVELFSEVIVVLLTVCTVLLLVGCLCCHRPSGFKEFRDSPVGVSAVSNVDNGLVNPSAEGAFTIFAPLGHNLSSSNDRFRLEDEYSYGDINVSSWFNEGAFDFPRTKLKYIREIGKGWFGSVVEGTAQDPEDNTWTPVVVRILDAAASNKDKVFFLHEAEIYKCGSHTNLLKLHGRCLNSDPFLLLQELCPQGDLKGYLTSNKRNDNLLASEYPLVWCCQITSALKFLHEKGLAHSDLACRNCQLTSNLTVKLGDYGLSPSRYPEDYYEGVPTVSVRWCAPESIRQTSTTLQPERITREANVWSLAVCFWEICECGARPYAELTDDEVVTQVLGKAHVRLPRPKHVVLYTDYVYSLMQSCWLTPESRPTSTQIYLTLTDLLQVFTVCKSESKDTSDLQESQESFDLRWNSLKPNNSGNSKASNQKSEVKPMSPSLNNLVGSLEDMNRSRTSEEDNANAVLLPGAANQKFEFELGAQSKEPLETDSLDDSMVYNMRRSSSSETEEENWKRKIERGAYTEKVRQKSRSVADLMVLTHIDCSESESETPQPSLDHRVNYRNVRLAPKHNLESASYVHGSEGNLLSVQDDFQAELRKLQEEHRDNIFFVPDKYSQTLRNEQVNNNLGIDRNFNPAVDSNERLIKELSSTSDITPVNQVYNVFNVTIDNLSPIHVVKLKEIINLEDTLDYAENKTFVSYEVPKLCDIIQNNSMVANIPDNYNEACQNGKPEVATSSEDKERFDLDQKCQTEKQSSSNDHTFLQSKESLHIDVENDVDESVNISNTYGNTNEKELNYHEIIENGYQTESIEISEIKQGTEIFEIVNEKLKTERSHFDEKLPCDTDYSSVRETQELLNEDSDNRVMNLNVTSEEMGFISEKKIPESPLSDCSKYAGKGEESSGVSNEDQNGSESLKASLSETGEILESGGKGEEIKSENIGPLSKVLNVNQNESEFLKASLSETAENLESEEKSKQITSENSGPPSKVSNENQNESESPKASLSETAENLESGGKDEEIESENSGPPSKISNENQNESESPKASLSETAENLESGGKDEEIESENSGSPSKVSNENQNESESPKASLSEIGKKSEESKSENNDSLGILNGNQNTLENVFVFQMGENLDSFEMNSQISDLDFSLRSEICKETLDKIDEGIDLENIILPDKVHQEEVYSRKNLMKKREDSRRDFVRNNCQLDPATGAKSYQVPKLIDLIENNDSLMDYIIAHYESELHDDLSCENSIRTNTAIVETKYPEKDHPVVSFDLSNSQEATNPNPLTHLNAFSSLKTKPKSSLELISSTPGKMPLNGEIREEGNNLNYSLETWDNFLGNALDTQTKNINDQAVVFESLNSEPQSLMFVETEGVDSTVTPPNSDTEVSLDGGFLEDVYSNQTINIEEPDDLNRTYSVEDSDLNKTFEVDGSLEEGVSDDQDECGTWESSGGWFLHPQSSGSVSGQIMEQRDVRSMDDEILAALRGELLAKLPHAQGSTSDKLKENDEEWDPSDKDEVFLRYNVYNTPLSPIPEESENEEYSDYVCTATGSPASEVSDDWPEKLLENVVPQEIDSQSLKAQGLQQHHTLSQDSCCSNDTLFNLEDMTYVLADQDEEPVAKRLEEERIKRDAIDYFKTVPLESPIADLESPLEHPAQDKTYLADFLVREREHSELVSVVVTEPLEENQSDSNSAPLKTAAPLPSPDDHPWKQLSDSLLKKGLLETDRSEEDSNDSATYVAANHSYENVEGAGRVEEDTPLYSEVEECLPEYANTSGCLKESEADLDKEVYSNVGNDNHIPSYVNVFDGPKVDDAADYENVGSARDTLNEADYVNITNLENSKVSADFDKEGCFDGNQVYEHADEDLIIRNADEDPDDQLLGVLTDIRFSGPGEPHLMSTSFSESNEIQNEQDWDSGSDTRSSSSGEFIWREGEHEESLKALQALPQDLLDDIEPSKGPKQDSSSESSCSDDEGECPEFIPSAWDKYATPTKSALRSPEKTLEKEEKKKGVWFKKQRYHCVYEYPKEPESPVLQSFDLWNNPPPATTYPEWYFDIDHNTEFSDFTTATNFSDGDTVSTDFTTSFNNEFFVTGSATPFDMISTSSQFFPGGENWPELSKLNENSTPDSGVEDVTPGSMDRVDFSSITSSSNVPTLKQLSEAAYARSKQKDIESRTSEILGGLRHTRDKLKLDLPSSPNTFTSNKTFSLEPNVEPVVIRERPAFTTFGKSRFLVQHVDTPDRDTIGKNVCFEALPYKPIEKKEAESKTKKIKKDEEKGEASLLDSADEDSGIESSTLERKSSDAGKLIVDL